MYITLLALLLLVVAKFHAHLDLLNTKVDLLTIFGKSSMFWGYFNYAATLRITILKFYVTKAARKMVYFQ